MCVEAGLDPHNYNYTEYTLPFNQKNFDKLYEQRSLKSALSASLIIYAEPASEAPRQITTVEQFMRPFDDIWLEAKSGCQISHDFTRCGEKVIILFLEGS